MKTEKAVKYVEESLSDIYCDSCKERGNWDICDYCRRKSMMWGISHEKAESIVDGIVMILKEDEKDEYAQIDCPMNQTECDENCVYYNKLLLKCPMKVKGNGGEQE